MSSHMMAISDLGEAFTILSLDTKEIDSKRPICQMTLVMLSLERLRLLG